MSGSVIVCAWKLKWFWAQLELEFYVLQLCSQKAAIFYPSLLFGYLLYPRLQLIRAEPRDVLCSIVKVIIVIHNNRVY